VTLTTIILAPVLVASVVLLFSFVGCALTHATLAPTITLHARPGVSSTQTVMFIIRLIRSATEADRDRLVVTPGSPVSRLSDPSSPMFTYGYQFTQRDTGEAEYTLRLLDVMPATTGEFTIRPVAFASPDVTATPVAEVPDASLLHIMRNVVSGAPERFPTLSFRVLQDFPPAPGEPPAGATEIRLGAPAIPPPVGNTVLSVSLNPDLFGSRPSSVDFRITAGGTTHAVSVAAGAPIAVPAALGTGSSLYSENGTHLTFTLRLAPASAQDWTVEVSASGVTSDRATIHVDPDPARSAQVDFRGHPYDGEMAGPARIGIQDTRSA
jgi:hypothetical protein